MTKGLIYRYISRIWLETRILLSIVIYNNNIDRVGNIKNRNADVTVEELRCQIYEQATGKNRKISNNFSKSQLSKIAEEIGAIEGSKCYFCGEVESGCLEQHHILPRSMGGTDSPNNLVTLCGSCHRKIEELYDPFKIRKLAEEAEKSEEKKKDNITFV